MRQDQYERSMAGMNYEMSIKTAESLAKYHTMYVLPIENRLRTIELLLGVAFMRWCYWKVADTYHDLYMRFTDPIADPEGEEKEPEPEESRGLLDEMADPVENEVKKAMRKEYPH